MKKLIATLMGGVVLFGPLSSVSSAADYPDEHWVPISWPQSEGWRSLYLGDNTTLNREPSTLYAYGERQPNTTPPSFHCSDVDSAPCIELTSIESSAFLQPCSIEILTNCIDSFYAIDTSGQRIDAQAPINYPNSSRWDYQGNDSINLPTGGTPTVWTIPGVSHGGGGNTYMVQAFANSHLQKKAAAKVIDQQFNLGRLIINITPVSLIEGRYTQNVAQDFTETPEKTPRGVMHPSIDEWRFCVMIGDGTCQRREAFPENIQFGVKIRIQKKIMGWLHGRIYNPKATITTAADNSQTIEVSALPVKVPIVGEWFRWSELSPAIQQYVLDGKVYGGQGTFPTKNLATGTFQEMVGTSGQQAFDALSIWLPQLKDRASANPSTWTFYNLSEGEISTSNNCIRNAKDLVGLVTTNASVYAAGTPTYSKETESLDYKVMAPHYTARGEIFKGSYDLRIRSEVARCIYGFSSAPVQASLSILSEDGTTQTATQTIQEKDGWLSLSANGFSYSSPTIKVKLLQPNPPVTPTPAPSNAVAKEGLIKVKIAITCKKARSIKKITGFNPKCPTGFKKVA